MINIRRGLKTIIGYLIQFIETIEYKNYSFDENDVSKKIIEEYHIDDLEIETDDGYQKVQALYITQPYHVFEIETEKGYRLDCADTHILFDDQYN